MKAIIQNLKDGRLEVSDVPPPALQAEGILVRVRRSLISLGTEKAVIDLAKKGPLGKAKARPDLARKVLNKARQEGLWSTFQVVRNLISSPIPLGYSCSGEVIAVGSEATEFRVGDRVACAGLNYANHAEINYVPRNLAVKIPSNLTYDNASFVTLGAIAMQGLRLAQIELGETVVVVGLGLVGQIAVQLARCAGATVLATDLDPDKVEMALRLGAHQAMTDQNQLAGAVKQLTSGHGADAVLICAATKSDQPVRLATELARLKARVVIVGDVGMHLDRRPFFEKELNLMVSRSYGPGRYDPTYEQRGHDYPLPYVRWTERRNMQSFVELAARNDLVLEPLITHRFPIDRAREAYQLVTGEKREPAIAILLEYEGEQKLPARVNLTAPAIKGALRIGVIGAGQFAKGVLLPAFAGHNSVQLRAVCTLSGLTGKSVAERYRAEYCTSDPAEVIGDKEIDAVVIATRHNHHARLSTEALRAGKAVFVEKPLALNEQSLAELCATATGVNSRRLMVGFNRRFSPLAVRMKNFFAGCAEPKFIAYRVNAGSLPPETWVYDPVEGGGRIIGEVCHFIDLICYLTGTTPLRIQAESLPGPGHPALERDSVTVTLRMTDGSVGVIHYLANGDASVPKEYLEMSGGQQTAILDNFRRLSLHRGNSRQTKRFLNQAKGHAEEVLAFINALRSGGSMPIDFETLVAVTRTTFLIHRSLDLGSPVNYE